MPELTSLNRETRFIKEGVIKFLQFESESLHSKLDIRDKLVGWEKILKDKCLNNEIMDVKLLNEPDLTCHQYGKD